MYSTELLQFFLAQVEVNHCVIPRRKNAAVLGGWNTYQGSPLHVGGGVSAEMIHISCVRVYVHIAAMYMAHTPPCSTCGREKSLRPPEKQEGKKNMAARAEWKTDQSEIMGHEIHFFFRTLHHFLWPPCFGGGFPALLLQHVNDEVDIWLSLCDTWKIVVNGGECASSTAKKWHNTRKCWALKIEKGSLVHWSYSSYRIRTGSDTWEISFSTVYIVIRRWKKT